MLTNPTKNIDYHGFKKWASNGSLRWSCQDGHYRDYFDGNENLAIEIDKWALERACKQIIENILFCLPSAYMGTVYLIGRAPELTARRITSGIIDPDTEIVSWGLPKKSDYNPPGKPWVQYRDQPGRPLEAMAWCVERQKSWTAENAEKDSRSVRLQVEGVWSDSHHMEPVIIRKDDLYPNDQEIPEYPKNYNGEVIWKGSKYVVVAVIKIHFRPNSIKINSPETKIIKRLSRALGTELLSYQLREQSLKAMRRVAEDQLNSYNILSDSLRNAISKSGLIFSLIKLELGFLRNQWELIVLQDSDQKGMKREAVQSLEKFLRDMGDRSGSLEKDLSDSHWLFLDLSLPPDQGENWVRMKIEEKWNGLFSRRSLDEEQVEHVRRQIDQLKRSLHLGKDPAILARYNKMPDLLKEQWVDLIYRNTDRIDLQFLDKLIHILRNRSLDLPYQEKSRKSLIHLKALAEVMGQLEHNTNLVLQEVLTGYDNGMGSNTLRTDACDSSFTA